MPMFHVQLEVEFETGPSVNVLEHGEFADEDEAWDEFETSLALRAYPGAIAVSVNAVWPM